MNKITIIGNSAVELRCAVLFNSASHPHSVMASNNPKWSASQRAANAKRTEKVKLNYDNVPLHISWQLLCQLHNAYLDIWLDKSKLKRGRWALPKKKRK